MTKIPENNENTFGEAQLTATEGSMSTLNALDLVPELDTSRDVPAVKRVFQGNGANLILFNFAPGQRLRDHKAIHPIMVQCLRGLLTFTYGEETVELRPGTILHLDPMLVHRVDCPDEASGEGNVLQLVMLTGKKN
ncbi:cupin domain-containing protein [Actinomycetaceae bacterium TAE3-ERU4]|nr:cupin domain-containing protein [Actinomycetaceae bacterium TAE3-ERU4]